MNGARETLDVSGLPTVVIGSRDIGWWGTLGFMTIEGTTLAVAAASYLYLRKNFVAWPPEPTPLPDLLVPTVNLVLILLAIVPMVLASRAAIRLDAAGVRRWLWMEVALSSVAVVLRYFEFYALNTWYDEHAYGSVTWVILGFHATLLLVDVVETAVIALIFTVGPVEEKHFADTVDSAFYQCFLSLVWVPLYVLIFLSPRWW